MAYSITLKDYDAYIHNGSHNKVELIWAEILNNLEPWLRAEAKYKGFALVEQPLIAGESIKTRYSIKVPDSSIELRNKLDKIGTEVILIK